MTLWILVYDRVELGNEIHVPLMIRWMEEKKKIRMATWNVKMKFVKRESWWSLVGKTKKLVKWVRIVF